MESYEVQFMLNMFQKKNWNIIYYKGGSKVGLTKLPHGVYLQAN